MQCSGNVMGYLKLFLPKRWFKEKGRDDHVSWDYHLSWSLGCSLGIAMALVVCWRGGGSSVCCPGPLCPQRFCCQRCCSGSWARGTGDTRKPPTAVAAENRSLSLGSKEGPFLWEAAGKRWKPEGWLSDGTGGLSPASGSSWRIKRLRAWASVRSSP